MKGRKGRSGTFSERTWARMKPGKWHALGVVALFLVLAGLSYVTSDPRAAVSGPERVVREALAPLQAGFAAVARWAGGAVETVASISRLREENLALRQEVARLKSELGELEELRRENQRLREIAGVKERLGRKTVVAQVIGRSYSQWFSTVTIDRGAQDGLKAGLPVLNAQGVVGCIESVTANTARVLLLTDSKSAVGGMVKGSEVPVLVEGTGDPTGSTARVRTLVLGHVLAPGEEVLTSGLSHVFPKGVPIGVIDRVYDDPLGLRQEAVLRPYVDFNRLDWVTVILDTEGGEVRWSPEEDSPRE